MGEKCDELMATKRYAKVEGKMGNQTHIPHLVASGTAKSLLSRRHSRALYQRIGGQRSGQFIPSFPETSACCSVDSMNLKDEM